MNSQDMYTVIAIGFQPAELDTLECVFQLSGRYALVNGRRELGVNLALLNSDDPNAILLWRTYLAEYPQMRTVRVAEQPGTVSSNPGERAVLARRFIARPCFAKQLLSALDHLSAGLPKPLLAQNNTADGGRLSRLLGRLIKPSATRANPYYTY